MGIDFSAVEIFEIAVDIEKNGGKFYRKAAESMPDEGTRKMMLDLAAMEDDHARTFSDMKAELSGREAEVTTFDPQGEAAMYLAAFAGGHVFDPKADPSEKLTGSESVADILRTAIGAEKDSIVFYLGIKDMVSEKAGKGKIDGIINEERGHITLLSNQLAAQ